MKWQKEREKMSKKQATYYTSEFKESAVKLVLESDKSVAETGRELGIKPSTLYGWIKQYSKPVEKSARTEEHIYDENKRLRKELARVIQERDLLKKAAAYFANNSQ